ncbi:MAG: hypothetical protein HQK83_13670 [Fibrobacteria bacterium]|nr:hypothetical protein [Fibrobacteria bacterium]
MVIRTLIFTLFLCLLISCKSEEKKAKSSEHASSSEINSQNSPVNTSMGEKPITVTAPPELNGLSKAELWAKFKSSREKADSFKKSGNYSKSIQSLVFAAGCAVKLEEPGMASWQFNNAAKHSIDFFRQQSHYDEYVSNLNTMKPSEEKAKYIQVFHNKLKKEYSLLEAADYYLKKARALDQQEHDKKRESVIMSNQGFIASVDGMLN